MRRNKMKLLKLTMAVLLLSASLFAGTKKSGPIGTWSFQAPDAPWGYHKGDLVIDKKDGKYITAIVFDQYNKVEGTDVVINGNKVSFNISLEGEIVVFMGVIENDKFTGKANYSEGELPIKAFRKINIDPSGTWKFKAPDAPEGYTEGKLIIKKEKDGKYNVQIAFDQYNKLDAENVKVDGNQLSFLAYVEGEAIFVKAEADKKEIKGKASYSEGTLNILATKE